MKYTTEISIDLPIQRVMELFHDTKNLKEWQPGLQSYTHLSGVPGQVGAKAKLIFKTSGRVLEMIETITVSDAPREFSGIYEVKRVWNEVRNFFSSPSPDTTKWVSECEFRFTNLFMKLVGKLMPGSFKKQSFEFQRLFKKFAESPSRDTSV